MPPYKAQGLRTWLLINAASAKLQHYPHLAIGAVLPSRYRIPSFFHPLLDGENGSSPESPIPSQTTSNTPSSSHSYRLIPPCVLDLQSPPKVQAAVSSLVSALAFLDVFQAASDTSKARLLDGSTQHGPSAWHVRMPKSRGSAISSRALTRSQLGRLICSLAPHISLIKTAYRAPSNQVSTAYLSEPMRVTSCAAVKGSVFMVLSVIRSKVRDELCFILER